MSGTPIAPPPIAETYSKRSYDSSFHELVTSKVELTHTRHQYLSDADLELKMRSLVSDSDAGVIATKLIEAGSRLKIGGELTHISEIPKETETHYIIREALSGRAQDVSKTGTLARFINASKTPNLKVIYDHRLKELVYITTRDILPYEPLNAPLSAFAPMEPSQFVYMPCSHNTSREEQIAQLARLEDLDPSSHYAQFEIPEKIRALLDIPTHVDILATALHRQALDDHLSTTQQRDASRQLKAIPFHELIFTDSCGLILPETEQWHITPLHLAVAGKQWSLVKKLSPQAALVDQQTQTGLSALMLALKRDDEAAPHFASSDALTALRLLGPQATLSASDDEEMTALHYCVERNDYDLVDVLLDQAKLKLDQQRERSEYANPEASLVLNTRANLPDDLQTLADELGLECTGISAYELALYHSQFAMAQQIANHPISVNHWQKATPYLDPRCPNVKASLALIFESFRRGDADDKRQIPTVIIRLLADYKAASWHPRGSSWPTQERFESLLKELAPEAIAIIDGENPSLGAAAGAGTAASSKKASKISEYDSSDSDSEDEDDRAITRERKTKIVTHKKRLKGPDDFKFSPDMLVEKAIYLPENPEEMRALQAATGMKKLLPLEGTRGEVLPNQLEVRQHHILPGYGLYAREKITKGVAIPYQAEKRSTHRAISYSNYSFYDEALSCEHDALKVGGIGRFANHSECANCSVQYNPAKESFEFVTLKEIPTGDELLFNYGCEFAQELAKEGHNQRIALSGSDTETTHEHMHAHSEHTGSLGSSFTDAGMDEEKLRVAFDLSPDAVCWLHQIHHLILGTEAPTATERSLIKQHYNAKIILSDKAKNVLPEMQQAAITPLMLATYLGKERWVKALLKVGGNPDHPHRKTGELASAYVFKNRTLKTEARHKLLGLLLSKRKRDPADRTNTLSIQVKSSLNFQNTKDETLLHLAVESQDPVACTQIMEEARLRTVLAADLRCVAENDLLSLACELPLELKEQLKALPRGISVNDLGLSPLMLALHLGEEACFKAMAEHKLYTWIKGVYVYFDPASETDSILLKAIFSHAATLSHENALKRFQCFINHYTNYQRDGWPGKRLITEAAIQALPRTTKSYLKNKLATNEVYRNSSWQLRYAQSLLNPKVKVAAPRKYTAIKPKGSVRISRGSGQLKAAALPYYKGGSGAAESLFVSGEVKRPAISTAFMRSQERKPKNRRHSDRTSECVSSHS